MTPGRQTQNHTVCVKICGITRLRDAQIAVDCGADYLGFIFAGKSPRFIQPEAARRIIRELPATVAKVGVFVDMPADRVVETLDGCGLDIAQLCGSESPAVAERIGIERVWKAFHLVADSDVALAAAFPAAALLADTMLPGRRGGTGIVCNWELARKLGESRRLVLAGGINAENIAAAMEAAHPAVVDIGSGVEAEPGKKSARKLKALFAAVENSSFSKKD